jgi:hypothetical protein
VGEKLKSDTRQMDLMMSKSNIRKEAYYDNKGNNTMKNP